MPYYTIAGLTVKIENCGGRTKKQARAYLSPNQDDSQNVDIYINIDEARVENAVKEHPELSAPDWDYMLSGNDFYVQLLKYNGILLHSSCVVVDGVAYAFSADSGVGKSTHTSLWLERFGDRAYILNDDKPAIREIDGVIYACGTPWSGKHDCSVPELVPLGGICFIERDTSNHIESAIVDKAVFNIFSQTLRKLGTANMNRLLDVVEKIFASVPLYQLGCDISQDAVDVSYGAMKRELSEILNEK